MDVLWWPEESWWERKSIPLLGFNLAIRQLLLLSFTGLLGFVFSSVFSVLFKISFPARIGVFLCFLSVGFVFASKRVKMAPVELQLYYGFVRKQGVLRDVTERIGKVQVQETTVPTAPSILPIVESSKPLLFGTIAGCLLASLSVLTLAQTVPLRLVGESLFAFVALSGTVFGLVDDRLRGAQYVEKANAIDKLSSGFILSVLLFFTALSSSLILFIQEIACGYLILSGILDYLKSRPRNRSKEVPRDPPRMQ
jgi:hypothetical protein